MRGSVAQRALAPQAAATGVGRGGARGVSSAREPVLRARRVPEADDPLGERRYIVCLGEERAKRERAVREAIVASLAEVLEQGEKSLVGNKGYGKYVNPWVP